MSQLLVIEARKVQRLDIHENKLAIKLIEDDKLVQSKDTDSKE
jgi:hypothetical protein